MWPLPLPGAVEPLWQLAQVPVTAAWLTLVAGDHAATAWQLSQLVVVVMCEGDRPIALVPLWQLAQLALTLAWLKLAGDQAVV